MSAQEILAELPRLSAVERETVAEALRNLTSAGPTVIGGRRGGLHPGAFVVADDFDEPLPDDFWLGQDA